MDEEAVFGESSNRGQKRARSTSTVPSGRRGKIKARASTRRGGRVPKGQDWWSQVEVFFSEKRTQWGDSFDAPAWKR